MKCEGGVVLYCVECMVILLVPASVIGDGDRRGMIDAAIRNHKSHLYGRFIYMIYQPRVLLLLLLHRELLVCSPPDIQGLASSPNVF